MEEMRGEFIETSYGSGESQRGFKTPSIEPYLSTGRRTFENEDGFGIFWYFSAVFNMNSNEPDQDEILVPEREGKKALILKRTNKEGGDWIHDPQGHGMARLSGSTTIKVLVIQTEDRKPIEVLSVSRDFTQQVGQIGSNKIINPSKRCLILGEETDTRVKSHGYSKIENPLPDKLYDSERFDDVIKSFSDYVN